MEITDHQKGLLAAALAGLKAANPERADWFRLSKSGGSIAAFDPEKEVGSMLYSVYLGHPGIVWCVLDGKALTCQRQEYEGFPDPPVPTPTLKVGDRVTKLAGRVWPGPRDVPAVPGMVVTDVNVVQGCDRNWSVRVRATDPSSFAGNYHEAAERYFAKGD